MKYTLLGMVLLMAALCKAHVCLFNPLQRGTMNGINSAGTEDCFLRDGPCGGRDPEQPRLAIFATDEPYTVVFQKNLDHYNPSNPGMFVVSVGEGSEDPDFQSLAKVADSDTPSLYVYKVNVTFPRTFVTHLAVVQVHYITNNPEAPPDFYQCADIMLI